MTRSNFVGRDPEIRRVSRLWGSYLGDTPRDQADEDRRKRKSRLLIAGLLVQVLRIVEVLR
jgi:hypothetical protein